MATKKPVIKFMKLDERAVIPAKANEAAAGYDLTVIRPAEVLPVNIINGAVKLHTGLAMEMPKGYYGMIVLRSSTGAKTQLRLANQVGIIDSDYRGEIVLLVENVGSHREAVKAGKRIAQLIIRKCEDVVVEEAEELTETDRGAKGIGSTGE